MRLRGEGSGYALPDQSDYDRARRREGNGPLQELEPPKGRPRSLPESLNGRIVLPRSPQLSRCPLMKPMLIAAPMIVPRLLAISGGLSRSTATAIRLSDLLSWND